MARWFAFVVALLFTSPAFADDPADVAFDPTIDECAAPDAHCLTDSGEPTDAELEAQEMALAEDVVPSTWLAAPADVACPSSSSLQDGRCVPDGTATVDIEGGCNASRTTGLVMVLALSGIIVWARRRRALLLVLAACALDSGSYDDAVDEGATGDSTFLDVYSTDAGDGTVFLLAHQAPPAGMPEPVAQFSLMREHAALPLFRASTTCGDHLVTVAGDDTELLGWARDTAGEGTADLVELENAAGCFAYEIDQEAIDALVADGFHVAGRVGYVWPPGLSDPPPPPEPLTDDPIAANGPAACPNVNRTSALQLLYASPGKEETLRFLKGCPGEVIVGEKRETGPVGSMKSIEAHAAGGRTAFVLDRHGDKLRELLLRDNGVERTVAYLKKKMQLGYDYIVIDEITASADFRDGTTLNRRLRKLLLRMPARTIIPYISIDLTQQTYGFAAMQGRKLLLRAFKLRARSIALEVYLHTAQVRAGAAPATFRRAADRLALAVRGLSKTAGINRRAITVIGTSMHSSYPQYRYLDQASYDLASLSRQVNALRHGSKRLRQQKGVGWYFVNKSDMAPPSTYSYDALIRRMRLLGLRFK
ncbi:MAG TPA: hypothetical protein VMZ53_01820 [Kofleriaceae bacterium]|nr:hypothetical protein [Kofleriaceae bacterium]